MAGIELKPVPKDPWDLVMFIHYKVTAICQQKLIIIYGMGVVTGFLKKERSHQFIFDDY